MRLAYYVPASLLRHEGIRRRAAATARTWRAAGHEVHEVLPATPDPPGSGLVALARWERARDAAALAKVEQLVRAGEVDHVHLRLFVPGAGWAALAAHTAVSVEVHALLDRPESPRDLYRVVVGHRPAGRLLRQVSGAVFITGEMSARFGYPSVPRTAIGNGVPLPEDTLPAPANARPALGFALGSRGSWHGLDRLTELARRVPEADWRVVTPTALEDWARRTLGDTSPVTVVTTGSREAYDEALAALDAAVGTLALDRRRLTEAAPLKVRDAVASGLPVLLPYRDTNLAAASDPAVLRIDPLDLDGSAVAVRSWLPGLAGLRAGEATRRLVDLGTIERDRLDFLAGLPR